MGPKRVATVPQAATRLVIGRRWRRLDAVFRDIHHAGLETRVKPAAGLAAAVGDAVQHHPKILRVADRGPVRLPGEARRAFPGAQEGLGQACPLVNPVAELLPVGRLRVSGVQPWPDLGADPVGDIAQRTVSRWSRPASASNRCAGSAIALRTQSSVTIKVTSSRRTLTHRTSASTSIAVIT
jgi:hypothetical protein